MKGGGHGGQAVPRMNKNILASINIEELKDKVVKSLSIINITIYVREEYDTQNYLTLYSYKDNKKDIMKDVILYNIVMFSDFCDIYLLYKYKYNNTSNHIYTWSNEMCNFLHIDLKSEFSTNDILNQIYNYIKVNNLQVSIDIINLDENLKRLFRIKNNDNIKYESVKIYTYRHKRYIANSQITPVKKLLQILNSIGINEYNENTVDKDISIQDFIQNILYVNHKDKFERFIDEIKVIINDLSYDEIESIYGYSDYTIKITELKNVNDSSNQILN